MNANVNIGCNIKAEVRDAKTKEILSTSYGKNLLVNVGRQVIRDLMGGWNPRPDEIAVGTGTASPAAGDTDLGTNVLQKAIDRRVQETYGVEFQMLLETSEANGNTLSEAGTFANGTLIARGLIEPTIAKHVGIEVTISHTFTVNAS